MQGKTRDAEGVWLRALGCLGGERLRWSAAAAAAGPDEETMGASISWGLPPASQIRTASHRRLQAGTNCPSRCSGTC